MALVFAESSRLFKVCVGIGYFAILVVCAAQLGAFADDPSEMGIRVRNAAVAMPLVTVYAFLCAHFLLRRTVESLSSVLTLAKSKDEGTALWHKFDRRIRSLRHISILCGLSLTACYLYVEELIASDLDPLVLFMNISAIPFWSASIFLILNLFFITRYVIVNFLDKESLDLFSLKALKPISDLVIYNIAICAGFLALTPMFWLGKSIPMFDLYLVFGVFLCFALYLFWPVFKVHFTLSEQKKLAIERINIAIRSLMREQGIGADDEFFDCPNELRKLASLISAKQELNASAEWPIDLPQGLKGTLITIGIPLSWAAGSLVENAMSQLTVFNG